MRDTLKIGKYKFKSRLIIGTGKYKNFIQTASLHHHRLLPNLYLRNERPVGC